MSVQFLNVWPNLLRNKDNLCIPYNARTWRLYLGFLEQAIILISDNNKVANDLRIKGVFVFAQSKGVGCYENKFM